MTLPMLAAAVEEIEAANLTMEVGSEAFEGGGEGAEEAMRSRRLMYGVVVGKGGLEGEV